MGDHPTAFSISRERYEEKRRIRQEGLGAAMETMRQEGLGAAMETMRQQADEIAALRTKVADLEAKGIHTCHADCRRPLCVAQRDNAALRETAERWERIAAQRMVEIQDKADMIEAHDRRVTELLEANDREVENRRALTAALRQVVECFEAARAEGLSEQLGAHEAEPGNLVDLVLRRLSYAEFYAQGAINGIAR